MRYWIAVIMLLAASVAWAAETTYTTEGGETVYGVAATGGGAALSNVSDWTLATGLVTNNITVSMTDLKIYDTFGTGTINTTFWNTGTAGAGTVFEAGGNLVMNTTLATDAAIVWGSETLNPRATDIWTIRVVASVANALSSGGAQPLTLFQDSSVPAPDSAAAFAAKELVQFEVYGSGNGFDVGLRRWNGAGTQQYYNGFSWGGTLTPFFAAAEDDVYGYELKNDKTNLYASIYDSAFGNKLASVAIPWADIRAEANTLYFIGGEPWNDAWYGVVTWQEAWMWGEYLTSSPTATMGEVTVGCSIIDIGIAEDNESGGSITWDYDIGAGFVTGKTLAQLKSALIGTSPDTLNLRSNHASDGEGNATFSIYSTSLCD